MGELARASLTQEEMLFKEFGIDAEILIDHAWGIEPCRMEDIKSYRPADKSICEGQVLSCPYPYEKARLIVQEMTESLAFRLSDLKMITDSLTLTVGYDRTNCTTRSYQGEIHIDHYGRSVPKAAHGTIHLDPPTNLGSRLIDAAVRLYAQITSPQLLVRRISIAANRVIEDHGIYQLNLFTDMKKLEREKKLQETMLDIKKRFGKNSVLKGTSFLDGATMRERNGQIGGHKA